MNRPPGRRFVRPAPLVWWPCHLRGGLLIAKKRPRAGMERRVVGCWLLPAGVGGVARRTASVTLVWIATGAVVGLLVVRAPSWLAGPFGRAAFVAWRSSQFLSKLNQRIFESGMCNGAPRGMVEGSGRALDGVIGARHCNWTALALDPTPIQMSIDPELAARGQNPHGIKACFGRTGRRRPPREPIAMHDDARTGSPLPRASALHRSFSSFSRRAPR